MKVLNVDVLNIIAIFIIDYIHVNGTCVDAIH
jgi:hypothetical protein